MLRGLTERLISYGTKLSRLEKLTLLSNSYLSNLMVERVQGLCVWSWRESCQVAQSNLFSKFFKYSDCSIDSLQIAEVEISIMKYYLIGKNIETSLSPKIHNFLFRLKGRKPTYQDPVSGKVLTLREMQDDSFGGMSITIPYKSLFRSEQAIIKQGQVSTKHGLLNTVYKNFQRKLCGTNTDIFGIQQCYQDNIQHQHKNALIIGAGATAQIFCAFFEQHGFKASFVNRSQGKEELRSRFGNIVDFLPLKPRPIDYKTALRYSTIVNTLPSEVVYDNWDDIQLNLKNLMKVYPRQNKTKLVYFNVNYRHKLDPIQELLRNKLSLHVTTLKGIDMLLWQAIEQNKHFCLDKPLHQQQYTWQYNKLRQELNLN